MSQETLPTIHETYNLVTLQIDEKTQIDTENTLNQLELDKIPYYFDHNGGIWFGLTAVPNNPAWYVSTFRQHSTAQKNDQILTITYPSRMNCAWLCGFQFNGVAPNMIRRVYAYRKSAPQTAYLLQYRPQCRKYVFDTPWTLWNEPILPTSMTDSWFVVAEMDLQVEKLLTQGNFNHGIMIESGLWLRQKHINETKLF
jgi:hypothetical protein